MMRRAVRVLLAVVVATLGLVAFLVCVAFDAVSERRGVI